MAQAPTYGSKVDAIDWTLLELECSRPLDVEETLFDDLCDQGVRLIRWLRCTGQKLDGFAYVRSALLRGAGESAELVQDDPVLAYAIADEIDRRLLVV